MLAGSSWIAATMRLVSGFVADEVSSSSVITIGGSEQSTGGVTGGDAVGGAIGLALGSGTVKRTWSISLESSGGIRWAGRAEILGCL